MTDVGIRRPAWTFALVMLIAALLLMASPGSADAKRFSGYVAGVGSGKGHSFIVGNGLNLVLIDRWRSFTRYKVCWTRFWGRGGRCWRGRTARRGSRDLIFTAAPHRVGTFLVRWYFRGKARTRWYFYNGPGD